eukprot:SAG11_NODE_6408_length_1318_cov_4.878689_1_plen_144_part_00
MASSSTLMRQWLLSLPDLDATFAQLDSNGDGHVSEAELVASGLPQPIAQCFVDLADSDGNGAVSLAEFHRLGELLREVEALRAQHLPSTEALVRPSVAPRLAFAKALHRRLGRDRSAQCCRPSDSPRTHSIGFCWLESASQAA